MSKSKNARTGTVPGTSHRDATEVGHITRFAPLGDNFCYLFDPRNGKTHHVKVNSEQFWTIMDEVSPKLNAAVLLDEARLAQSKADTPQWAAVVARLETGE
jgi:hypothetical protein